MKIEFNPDGSLKIPERKYEIIKEPEYIQTGVPALLSIVEPIYIKEALKHFENNKKLYFYTNVNLNSLRNLDIKHVYIKIKGDNEIIYFADFIDITSTNLKEFRLRGYENDEGSYYYGFSNLKLLYKAIPIEDLKYYNTGNYLRNDFQGVVLIIDPSAEDNHEN